MVGGDGPLASEKPQQALLGDALGEPAERPVAEALRRGPALRGCRFREPAAALGLEVGEAAMEPPAECGAPAGRLVVGPLAAVLDLAVQPVVVAPGGNEVDVHRGVGAG